MLGGVGAEGGGGEAPFPGQQDTVCGGYDDMQKSLLGADGAIAVERDTPADGDLELHGAAVAAARADQRLFGYALTHVRFRLSQAAAGWGPSL